MKKPLAATLIAATAISGAAAGATLLAPGVSGAQDTTTAPSTAPGPDVQRRDPAAHITEALQPLVDNGTLTDSQVQAVIEALQAARPHRGDHPGRPNLDSVAAVLGTDADTLGQELRDGQSLADIAAANGVDTQDVVDAIVAQIDERIQAGVDAGKLDQTKADEMLANAETRAQAIVNGTARPDGPRGHHGPGQNGPGFGGPGQGGPGQGGPQTPAGA